MSAGHSANAGVHMELGGMVPGVHSAEVQMAPTAIPASPAATGNHFFLYFEWNPYLSSEDFTLLTI